MFKENITKYPKAGDIITIIGRNESTMWTSGAGGRQPNGTDIKYPFTAEIIKVNYSTHPAINLEGWGFDLDYVSWEFAKEKETIYEIY